MKRLYIFLWLVIHGLGRGRMDATQQEASRLPRLIIVGRELHKRYHAKLLNQSDLDWMHNKKLFNQKKFRKDDIIVAKDRQLQPTIKGVPWREDTAFEVSKHLSSLHVPWVSEIIVDRAGNLPLSLHQFIQQAIKLPKKSNGPSMDLVYLGKYDSPLSKNEEQGYVDRCVFDDVFSMQDSRSSVLEQYVKLLVPGGRLTFRSGLSILNRYGRFMPSKNIVEDYKRLMFLDKEGKRPTWFAKYAVTDSEQCESYMFFDALRLKDKRLREKIYRHVLKRNGLKSITFQKDPKYASLVKAEVPEHTICFEAYKPRSVDSRLFKDVSSLYTIVNHAKVKKSTRRSKHGYIKVRCYPCPSQEQHYDRLFYNIAKRSECFTLDFEYQQCPIDVRLGQIQAIIAQSFSNKVHVSGGLLPKYLCLYAKNTKSKQVISLDKCLDSTLEDTMKKTSSVGTLLLLYSILYYPSLRLALS